MSATEELLDRGLGHHQAGRLQEAEEAYQEILRIDPLHADALHLLGLVRLQHGQHAAALENIGRAIGVKPDSEVLWRNLSVAYHALGRHQEAVDAADQALRLNPSYAEAHNNRGVALMAQRKLDEAVASFRQAVRLQPNYVRAHNNLGIALRDHGELDEAVRSFQNALEIEPNSSETHRNLGIALRDRGELDRAKQQFEKVLKISPNDAEAHMNLGFLLLRMGDFEAGWPQYEWRWGTKQFKPRNFTPPVWDGRAIAGQTLLVYAEQGLGDTLQFVRYAALVRQRAGCRVVVECQKPLATLLSSCSGIDQLVAREEELPPFDFHVPLLSLPRLLGTHVHNIPAGVPYLFAREALVRHWRDRLSDCAGFTVGICWQGSPTHESDRRRSFPLAHLAALAAVPGVDLISLQKGAGAEQMSGVQFPVMRLGLDDESWVFMDTAAVVRNLDLVVTADTSVAHLAGALGVPVWVALPKMPDWRWQLDRDDSPWYPTMRLFRQEVAGDWAPVFRRINSALRERVTSCRQALPHT
jgi:tetratricopeptide (TPR) repeat protein